MAAQEIMLGSPAVANLIREGKIFQIPSIIQTSRKDGMITMDQKILELLDKELVTVEEAYVKANDKKTFAHLLKGPIASH